MSNRHVLKTPISDSDLESLQAGDVIYLSGTFVTCRDVAHRRLVEYGRQLPIDIRGLAIFHAGPIVKEVGENEFQMVSIGPTTSMRMEKFEKAFIEQTGVKIVIGKGGMGPETMEACRDQKAICCVFPAGCGVVAADAVEKIESANWRELGMPETLWECKTTELGPLIVSIDTHGNNLFTKNGAIYNERKKTELDKLYGEIRFIK